MLPVDSVMAGILQTVYRAPRAYGIMQIPLISQSNPATIDYQKLGSQLVLSNIQSVRRVNILEPGSDTLDVKLAVGPDGYYSPINESSPAGRYFFPGAVDNKLQLYLGLSNEGQETLLPKGVFVEESFSQVSYEGTNDVSMSLLDQWIECKGQVYTQFPPKLYGNQTSSYYNPNYALRNPTGDMQTYVCDCTNWMQANTDNVYWSNDYIAVEVYVGSSTIAGTTTTAAFTVPTVGTTVALTVTSTSGFLVNGLVNVVVNTGDGDVMTAQVTAITDSTHMTVKNLGVPGTDLGHSVASGASVTSGPASTACDPTIFHFTIEYEKGVVTFANPLPAGSVVSVDARPLAMAPELMIYHLFVDYASLDPNFLKIDNTGIQLPVMENARDRSILDIAKEIAQCTAPRGIQWQIYFDELGYLVFTEAATDGPPVKILTDERDILKISPEYTSRDIYNVVRANATSANDQPITVIAYDVASINTFSQKPTYDIPSQLLATVGGLDPGSAVSLMNGLTSSVLFANSQPTITTDIEILYDPSLQVSDALTIVENKTGINKDFYIKQITEEMNEDSITQTLRIEQLKKSQDYMFGLGAYIGAPLPTNANSIQATGALITSVSIAGTEVVYNGKPVTDNSMNPVVATWDGGNLDISITTAAPYYDSTNGQAEVYIWRWIYIAEDAYELQPGGDVINLCTGNGSSANLNTLYPTYETQTPSSPYAQDVTGAISGLYYNNTYPWGYRTNSDIPTARRYFWPLIRPSSWYTNDGVTGVTAAHTWSDTITQGPGASGPNVQFYGNLRVGLSNYFGNVTSGYRGVALYKDTGTITTTSGTFKIPAVNSNVVVPVTSGTAINNGTVVNIVVTSGGNVMSGVVISGGGTNSLTVNCAAVPVADVGTTSISGGNVSSGTVAANYLGVSSNWEYGVDFGPAYGGSGVTIAYGLKRKFTPCYLGIMVATTAGQVQLKRIPFQIEL
jgi:hypothetical protein